MQAVSKRTFITPKQNRIMELLHDLKVVTFEEQKIFTNKPAFVNAMEKLSLLRLVERVNHVSQDMRANGRTYRLVFPEGYLYVEKFIFKYNELIQKWKN